MDKTENLIEQQIFIIAHLA